MNRLWLFPSILLLAAATQAATVKSQHVSVNLVAEQRSIRPDSSFTVGLSFAIEPGWHLYWMNPGDAGQPPSVRWTLPPEITAGDIEWPYPEGAQLGSIVNYVYSGDLLLPITLQAGRPQGKSAALSAEVKWLVCRDICIPGKATLSLELPISPSPQQNDPAQQEAFAQTRAKMPKPLESPMRTLDIGQQFIIKIDHLELRAPAEFFPLVPDQIDNATAPRVISMGKGLEIYVKKSDQLLKPIQQLTGVLVLNDGRSFVIDSPLESSNTKKRK